MKVLNSIAGGLLSGLPNFPGKENKDNKADETSTGKGKADLPRWIGYIIAAGTVLLSLVHQFFPSVYDNLIAIFQGLGG